VYQHVNVEESVGVGVVFEVLAECGEVVPSVGAAVEQAFVVGVVVFGLESFRSNGAVTIGF